MKLLDRLGKMPGALMLVPLLVGTLLNTLDQMHFGFVGAALEALGVPADANGHRSFLRLGGFTTALTGPGATTLIAFFLVCVAAQMDFAVGRRALKKGLVITSTKWVVGLGVAYAVAALGDGFMGPLGLSMVAVLAAMTNGNGGLYLALTSRFGDRSDVGAISVISLNDGPFLTLLGLGILGERFPFAAFLAVLLPLLVGFALGRWDERIRRFLAPGERLAIPFFAFALGTTLTFTVFTNLQALVGGVALGVLTVLFTGSAAALTLRLVGERVPVAAWAEASTAGNAVQTPTAVALAAAALGTNAASERLAAAVPLATAQISVAVLVSALLCPLAVAIVARRQAARARPEAPTPAGP